MGTEFDYITYDDVFSSLARGNSILTILQEVTNISRIKNGFSTHESIVTLSTKDRKEDLTKIVSWLKSRGYRIFPCGFTRVAVCDCDNKYVLALVYFRVSEVTVSASFSGDLDEVKILKLWFKESFGSVGTSVATAIDINDRGVVMYERTYMSHDSINLPKQEFYPWLGVDLKTYVDAYMKSDETVLVIYGPPGTGKSTFLRYLIVSSNYKTILAYGKKVIESPLLISDFYEKKDEILVYEDIDLYIKRREDGNQLMSTLLNASEGVVQNKNKKIVFSTNLENTSQIDPALLRVGRCFDILHFRELTPDEASAACASVGGEQKDWNTKKSWPLAEVLAKKNTVQQVVNRFGRKTGFINNR